MKILLLIASLLVPTIADADTSNFALFALKDKAIENHFDDGVMHVNRREFLMGDLHEWPKANVDYSVSFMVRSSIWLRDFLDNDPVLKYQDFDIRRTQDSSFTGARYLAHRMELTPDPPRNCEVCHYQLTLDPSLQVQGYDTYSNGTRSLRFLPKDSEVAHGFNCRFNFPGSQIGELEGCSVVVVYPYATNIVLNGHRFRPGTVSEYGPKFAAIAERMLEVVTCIDITDNQDSERTTELSQLLESHPNLTGCKIDQIG